eukprot:TRINITY_DN42236_c0_g1_i1.p1 TRINITY_DN42236_c0_g1~~TRINITY_DN42236_c0_g1_i1.p1  ORF type:complete len:105 (-),score=1.37 TRINITY_DN42236_c0_g1_i1:67-381(-)
MRLSDERFLSKQQLFTLKLNCWTDDLVNRILSEVICKCCVRSHSHAAPGLAGRRFAFMTLIFHLCFLHVLRFCRLMRLMRCVVAMYASRWNICRFLSKVALWDG